MSQFSASLLHTPSCIDQPFHRQSSHATISEIHPTPQQQWPEKRYYSVCMSDDIVTATYKNIPEMRSPPLIRPLCIRVHREAHVQSYYIPRSENTSFNQHNSIIPISISPFLPKRSFFIKPVIFPEHHIRQNDCRPRGKSNIFEVTLYTRDTRQSYSQAKITSIIRSRSVELHTTAFW